MQPGQIAQLPPGNSAKPESPWARKGLQRKARRKRRKALTRNWSGKPGPAACAQAAGCAMNIRKK
jgi:hypothetical protein